MRIGRHDRATLTLSHPDVSRVHAVLYYAEGWCLADEGSTNGTYLNGERVDTARLGRDVEIVLGRPGSGVILTATFGDLVDVPRTVASLEATVLKGAAPQPFRYATPVSALAPGATAFMIGKGASCDIRLDDIHVSREHARAVVVPGGFIIEDLGSLNGTFVNAIPVQRAFLGPGDTLTIGNTDFTVVSGTLRPTRGMQGGPAGLRVTDVSFDVARGKRLMSGVALDAPRGTLTAVIGPSGAGKSTLSRLLSGTAIPTSGRVEFDGFDLVRDYETVKSRVGLVPQDDVVHRQLSVKSALRFAARLRLGPRSSTAARRDQIARVEGQLGLSAHRATRIERLSGGQRKRVSVALELLTEPSLLILDEPTSGLDPALDRQVMHTLRELADGDRTVIVITHSVAYLSVCDQVVVLAPGGHAAFVGAPAEVAGYFGTEDWGDIFGELAAAPGDAAARWRSRQQHARAAQRDLAVARRPTSLARPSWFGQFFTLVARQCAVMGADRGYAAFMAALPIVIGLLTFVVPGSAGLNEVPPGDPAVAAEPRSILALLVIGATFMGISLSIRDLVGERAIYLRERAVGLSPWSYLASKVVVFGVISAISTLVMVLVCGLVKPLPRSGLFSDAPLIGLVVPLILLTWISAILGLLASSVVRSNDQVMPVLIVILMVQLVLHGGLISIVNNDLLNAASRFTPARWGYAGAAAGIDLESLMPSGPGSDHDDLWRSTRAQWGWNCAAVVAFGVVFATGTWAMVRGRRR